MTRFAENTTVSPEKSRGEIERILERYGATGFQYGWQEVGDGKRKAKIEFEAQDRHVRFLLPLPSRDSDEFTKTTRGKDRTDDAAIKSWEQACRQRWRALALAIKAKLEAVNADITDFEDEFMSQVVDPETGMTIGEIVRPMIALRYEGRPSQLALPAPKGK